MSEFKTWDDWNAKKNAAVREAILTAGFSPSVYSDEANTLEEETTAEWQARYDADLQVWATNGERDAFLKEQAIIKLRMLRA